MPEFSQNLNRMVGEEFIEKMTFEQRSQRAKKQTVNIWLKNIPGRVNSKCKGPEAGG